MHIWDVWNERDHTAYADYVPRFVSEFGFQGPSTCTPGAWLRLPVPGSFWNWAMSLNQARAVQFGVEHFRSNAPRCAAP